MKQQALIETKQHTQDNINTRFIFELNRLVDSFNMHGINSFVGAPEQEERYINNETKPRKCKADELWSVWLENYNKGNLYQGYPFDTLEAAKQTAIDLGLRERNGALQIKVDNYEDNGGFECWITFENCISILKDFQTEIGIDWSKKCYQETGKAWGRKVTSIYTKQALPKEYIFTLNPTKLAWCYESKEALLNEQEYVFARENLETAKKALQNIIDNYTDKNKATIIKNHKNMVDLWQTHVNAWDKVAAIEVNYERVKEIKLQEALQIEADNSPECKHIQSTYNILTEKEHLSTLSVLQLFKKYDIEPTKDMDIFICLLIADKINNPDHFYRRKWSNSLPLFDKFMQYKEIQLKDKQIEIKDKFLKKDGQPKKMVTKTLVDYNQALRHTEKLELTIKHCKDYEKTIKEFIN